LAVLFVDGRFPIKAESLSDAGFVKKKNSRQSVLLSKCVWLSTVARRGEGKREAGRRHERGKGRVNTICYV
jgi:hypothetical protein